MVLIVLTWFNAYITDSQQGCFGRRKRWIKSLHDKIAWPAASGGRVFASMVVVKGKI